MSKGRGNKMRSNGEARQDNLLLALAALRENRLDDAERLSRELLAAAPDAAGPRQLAAAIALQRGDFAEAERLALSCLALKPRHIPALILAGRAALAAGDAGLALRYFGQATDLSPDDPEPAFQLCCARISNRDPAANALLELLSSRFPDYASGWSQIGAALRVANMAKAAAAAFARATRTTREPRHFLDLGTTLLTLEQPAAAATALRGALALAPDFAPAYIPLARALRQTGDAAAAREALLRGVALMPKSGEAFFLLGLVCEDLRDDAGAIAAYRRRAELPPDAPEVHVNLGIALQRVGDFEAALQSYRRAIRLRADTFARVAQALPAATKGQLWLDLGRLRHSLGP